MTTIPDDATVMVEVPTEPRPRNWTLILLVVALVMSAATNVGVVIIVKSTGGLTTRTAAEEQAIIEHRVRNEEAHAALCAKMDAVARRFQIPPEELVDENGKVVTCPKPLSDAEIRALSAHDD